MHWPMVTMPSGAAWLRMFSKLKTLRKREELNEVAMMISTMTAMGHSVKMSTFFDRPAASAALPSGAPSRAGPAPLAPLSTRPSAATLFMPSVPVLMRPAPPPTPRSGRGSGRNWCARAGTSATTRPARRATIRSTNCKRSRMSVETTITAFPRLARSRTMRWISALAWTSTPWVGSSSTSTSALERERLGQQHLLLVATAQVAHGGVDRGRGDAQLAHVVLAPPLVPGARTAAPAG